MLSFGLSSPCLSCFVFVRFAGLLHVDELGGSKLCVDDTPSSLSTRLHTFSFAHGLSSTTGTRILLVY